MQNAEPEVGYAQEVHEVVCFQPEDVLQEVRIQFGSKPGKIQPFELSKNQLKATKTKRKDVLHCNHRHTKKASMAFQVSCLP